MNLFIFRRDLRLFDNKGLDYLYKKGKKIIPLFIFDTKQICKKNNKYFLDHSVQFMHESLHDLNLQLHKHETKLNLKQKSC